MPSVSKVPAVVAQPLGGSLRPKLGANAGSPKIIPIALDEQRHQLEERIRAEKVQALELNMQESKQRLWKCLVGQKSFRVIVSSFPLLLSGHPNPLFRLTGILSIERVIRYEEIMHSFSLPKGKMMNDNIPPAHLCS